MPYNEEYPKVARGGHLKLMCEFRDENNELFDPDDDTAKITIINPSLADQVTNGNLTKESIGIYYYLLKPDTAWEFGLYRANYEGDKDDDQYNGKVYFLVSSNKEIRSDWQIITPEQIIRDYLVGDVGLEYGECTKKIKPATIWHFIDVAIAVIERDIQVRLRPVNIKSGDVKDLRSRISLEADLASDVIRTDIIENPYDYNAIEYWYTWGFFQLREYPVIEVSSMRLIYPTGQKIMDIPNQWLKINHRKGQIRLVPTAGTIDQVMIGAGGQWLPLMSTQFPGYVPQLIYIDYVAGMLSVPADYKDAIAKMVCVELLRDTSDAITRGLASSSTSIDGLSQSMSLGSSGNTLLYQARVNEYKEDIAAFKKARKERDKGIIMTVA